MTKYFISLLVFSFVAFTISCKESSSKGVEFKKQNAARIEADDYSDGKYCAAVRYINVSTDKISDYTLTVEVDDGKLAVIYWPNGGWLDESHFEPPDLDESGFAAFISDQGYKYQVQIENKGRCGEWDGSPGSLANEDLGEGFEDEDVAVVVKRLYGCDYFVAENNAGYIVFEWMGGYDPDEGEKIRGLMNRSGTREYSVVRKDRTTKLFLDDYSLDEDEALEMIDDQCQ